MEGVKDRIAEFLTVFPGYGDGYGDGDGSGYGSGDGDGYGYSSGYGDGDGSGDGSGSGDSSGYGYGDGDGYGYSSGYGDGSGYGSGYGDGIVSFCGNMVCSVDDTPTIIDHVHGNIARGSILRGDMTLAPCYIVKAGTFFAHGATLQKAQSAAESKLFNDMPVEERITAFLSELKCNTKYPAKKFFDWHNRLTGSCEMGRKAFARDHGIDIEHDEMTVAEFVAMTENAYGGGVIRQIKERVNQ